MPDGLWSVLFRTSRDVGGGVVTISNGKVMGGDSSFCYIGTIAKDQEGNVFGKVRINRHNDMFPPVIPGLQQYTLIYSGVLAGDRLILTGYVEGNDHLKLTIDGKKIAAL